MVYGIPSLGSSHDADQSAIDSTKLKKNFASMVYLCYPQKETSITPVSSSRPVGRIGNSPEDVWRASRI
ncbi:putative transporter MCH2 [Fusarium oxysporum f. sp. albedinis]|nr:putative transporter MCH2 [Fusarium oxysporum f. sp. albedinis]